MARQDRIHEAHCQAFLDRSSHFHIILFFCEFTERHRLLDWIKNEKYCANEAKISLIKAKALSYPFAWSLPEAKDLLVNFPFLFLSFKGFQRIFIVSGLNEREDLYSPLIFSSSHLRVADGGCNITKGVFSFRYNKIYPIVTPAMYRNKMSWLAKINFWLPTTRISR